MKALMIEDLSRNDELTVEEMKASKGGIGGGRLLDETYEPASGAVGVSYNNSVSGALDAIFKAATVAAQKVG